MPRKRVAVGSATRHPPREPTDARVPAPLRVFRVTMTPLTSQEQERQQQGQYKTSAPELRSLARSLSRSLAPSLPRCAVATKWSGRRLLVLCTLRLMWHVDALLDAPSLPEALSCRSLCEQRAAGSGRPAQLLSRSCLGLSATVGVLLAGHAGVAPRTPAHLRALGRLQRCASTTPGRLRKFVRAR